MVENDNKEDELVKIGLIKETKEHERRVALIPHDVWWLTKQNFNVHVQAGAGVESNFSDQEYIDAGAIIVKNIKDLCSKSEILLGLNLQHSLQRHQKFLKTKHILVGLLRPIEKSRFLDKMKTQNVTIFDLALMPRIARAQSMDILSSMATIAGYQSIITAADMSPRLLPMLITAAGTVAPAKVFIIGAGVAGLQACATAKRLGAIVDAYDVREAAQDQILSVGATPVKLILSEHEHNEDENGYATEKNQSFLEQQREALKPLMAKYDIIVTTASIPNRVAPILITKTMIETMKSGSIIVDLSAESGGNTEITELGEVIDFHQTTVIGPTEIASFKPMHASQMVSHNIKQFLTLLGNESPLKPNFDDDIIRETCLFSKGKIITPPQKPASTDKTKETS